METEGLDLGIIGDEPNSRTTEPAPELRKTGDSWGYPLNSVLQSILETYAEGVFSGLEEAFDRPVLNFRRDLYPLLSLLDSRIPGIGMHYAVWSKTTPHYPFSQEFDGVVRPLRYVSYELASGVPFSMMAREIVSNSGGHLEECVEELCRVKGIKTRGSLGALVRATSVRSYLGAALTDSISQFCDISWNKAKHRYLDGSPTSVITVEDALGSYFVARALGARVLQVAGRLEDLTRSVEAARERRKPLHDG